MMKNSANYNTRKLLRSLRTAAAQPVSRIPEKQLIWSKKLLDEQDEILEFILKRLKHEGGVGLFAEQGTGKTLVACAVLEHLNLRLSLIVAPLTSLDVTWSDRLSTLGKHIARHPSELKGSPEGEILLIHPEAIRKIAKRLMKLPWDIVIWDESQNIKERNSANSRAARRLRFVKRRLALSGTPIDDSQIDIWAQMRFIDHEVFGENWGDFADEYCRKGGWMKTKWIFRKSKHQQFLHVLRNHICRLSKSFLNLPPLTLIPVPVQMVGEQDRLYQQMDNHSIIRIGKTKIIAPLAITRDVKKSQITGGYVLDDDRVSHRVGEAKMRKLRTLISRLCGVDFSDGTLRMKIKRNLPIVIFCQFLPELEAIQSELSFRSPLRIAVLRGKIKGDERTQVIKDFQNGGYDIIICQVRTGGVSIELSRAATMIFYSFNFSYIDFEQIMSRLHRGGQTRPVTVWLIYCVGTIDEEKLDVIESKAELSSITLKPFEGALRNGEESEESRGKSPGPREDRVRRSRAGEGDGLRGSHRSRQAARRRHQTRQGSARL